MRNKSFVAEHGGGELTLDNHRLLMKWAITCTEHVVEQLNEENLDIRLIQALDIAKDWTKGNVNTGLAMEAARQAHAAARDCDDPVLKSISRSIAQAVSSAHMADHILGASLYALKAIRQSEKSVQEEIEWQNRMLDILPQQLIDLVIETREIKRQGFKVLKE
ncbi:hypothetical protein BCY89_27715 [Sphingobacterium siyangense]|uniref:Imm-5-like domain-containing protein n=1 Tax=Sphingobacterium siyangense TaxID=459529 RepID=A0A420FXL3_9SPHI|nr:hypothetical protein [Sphingobacterium siyangense]RKF37669.1 hypothetical protein BCY89_27715 [Sphingobacterium siyangense]